jgi:hypothetical protein
MESTMTRFAIYTLMRFFRIRPNESESVFTPTILAALAPSLTCSAAFLIARCAWTI